MKVKYVKLAQENIYKFYLQVINDASVKIAAAELCFEKKTKESIVETFKNVLQDFINKLFEKNCFRRHFTENRQRIFLTFSRFWPLRT